MDVCNTRAQYRHYRIYTSCYLEQSQNSVIIDNTGTRIMDDSRQLLDCGKWVPIFMGCLFSYTVFQWNKSRVWHREHLRSNFGLESRPTFGELKKMGHMT